MEDTGTKMLDYAYTYTPSPYPSDKCAPLTEEEKLELEAAMANAQIIANRSVDEMIRRLQSGGNQKQKIIWNKITQNEIDGHSGCFFGYLAKI